MATVYVIHAEEDTRFVKQRVLRGLPSIGYDCWLARHHFADVRPDEHVIAQAMDQSPAILIVLSPALIKSPTSGEEVVSALAGRHTLIVVQIAALGEGDAARLPEKLWALPKVDFTVEAEDDARRLLAGLLPPVGGEPEPSPKEAERIEWNEEIFSAALANAIARHAHARAESLVATIIGHIKHRPYPYPPKHAFNDLNRLRLEREFELMCRYAEAVIASGTRQDAIRRLFAQALIETRQYDRALEILKAIINEPDSSPREVFEAQGLIGRTFKQRYVEAPNAPGAAEMIRQAITAYEAVYVQDSSQYWHGVNAASCILRAVRDGVAAAPPSRAREIAQQIVDDLDRLSLTTILEVWDCASRVEALLALGRYDEAERALDVYINHPDMNRPDWRETMAFGVRSTFRQFDQLLELGRAPRGAALLARLHEAMERYRAVNVVALSAPAMKRAGEPEGGAAVRTRPLIIRVWDPAWEPKGVTDLVIQTRFGQVITARGSDVGVRQLLEDSTVAAVEDSRPAAQIECDRSVPFIKAAAQYSSAGGPYKETGDRALIAVIDNGIDILHKAFLGADGNSRIVGIWDQTDGGGTPPKGFSYGTFHDAAAIAGYLKTGFVPFTLGRNVQGHGTHVASIAGGRAAGNFFGGVAPDAKLLVVVSDGSGPNGYALSYIEALAFIDAFAGEVGLPVVVNMSQGINAGAHDGKSTLEVAFDTFSGSGRRPGRVVVKSAGNERNKGGHAKITLARKSKVQLRWRRDNNTQDYTERIELWWNSANEINFRLREPDPPGTWSDPVGTGTPELKGTFEKGGPYRLVFTKYHVDNGDSQLLIELGDNSSFAATGDWALEMSSGDAAEESVIHAWIERGQEPRTSFLNHIDEEMTLSVPSTAMSVIAVGAVEAVAVGEAIEVGDFSSYGPTRDGQRKPLVCAPGVNIQAACGGTDDNVFLKSGTSMAAPHVTGAIALLLSRTAKAGKIPSGNQITAALRQKTQNYSGHWERGQGYGVIDVAALLAAFG